MDVREEKVVKTRDIAQVVRYLTKTFNTATAKLERASRVGKPPTSNTAYIMQSEFACLLNELMQAPPCVQPKWIADCNEYIDYAMTYVNSLPAKH